LLKTAQDAGLEVKQVELDPATGRITITTGDSKKPAESGIIASWKANRARTP